MISDKTCTKCKKQFPATNEFFDKGKGYANGLNAKCKICRKKERQENKEKIAEKNKQYRIENEERINKRRKEYRVKNKAEIAQRDKIYREKNKEKIKEKDRKYREANRKTINAYKSKYRANKKDLTPNDANLSLIKDIYKNCPDGYQVDHIFPLSRGGQHHQDNLCYLPSNINASKNNKTVEEFGVSLFNEHVVYWQKSELFSDLPD